MRANDRATIIAHPGIPAINPQFETRGTNTLVRTIEPGLEGSVFASAAFAIVVVYDEGPWLSTGLEALGYGGDGIRLRLCGGMLVIESDVDVSAFIVHGLHIHEGGVQSLE